MATKTGNKSLAAIYAEALYEAAQEAGVLDQVAAELLALREIISRSPKLELMLVSPTVSFESKRKVIESTFTKFTPITRNFLSVVVERKRAAILETVVTEFQDHANRTAGIASVQVKSAQPLEDAEREKLKTMLHQRLGKKIDLHEEVQAELLGGLVLQHEDKVWDASVAHKLRKMVEEMEELKVTVGVIKDA